MPRERLPPIGLGTMRYDDPRDCVRSVEAALEMGYRHVDTAQKYENEREVGEGIARSSVPREEITLATKVAEGNLAYDDVLRTTDESLDRLDVDSVDILYVHWPAIAYDPEETLAAIDRVVEEGKARRVGLGNFDPDLLEEAREYLDEPIFAIQVEMHPYLQQRELRSYALENDAYLVAYCPLMRGEIFDQPEIREIAADAGLSVAQLSLAWSCSKDRVRPIPKATGEEHLRENLEAVDLEVDEAILERVDLIDDEQRIVDPPEKGPWNR